MRKPCLHGLKLEKNLRCDHGRLQVYFRSNGQSICKNIGEHTRANQEIAARYLSDRKHEIAQGLIGIKPELPSKKFSEVADIWFKLWQKERNPDGTEAHNKDSCYKVLWTIHTVLAPKFGHLYFEQIRSVEIDKWRCLYTDKGLSGTTANRYQAILSSIFSHVDKWVKTERIKPAFKVPAINPCDAVEMAPSKKRTRILSGYEAKKLKMAFLQLQDQDGWEICKMALKSVLSMKDLKNLEIGQEIDIERSKTGVPINIPLPVLSKLNWFGWRTRWEKAREIAGLNDLQFRDLRKAGGNILVGKHDLKLISQYMGHASIKTTEASYTVDQIENMRPLAETLNKWVEEI